MSDIPKFIKHFQASAAYHRKKAEQAEAEVARLEVLLSVVRPTQRALDSAPPYTAQELDIITNPRRNGALPDPPSQ